MRKHTWKSVQDFPFIIWQNNGFIMCVYLLGGDKLINFQQCRGGERLPKYVKKTAEVFHLHLLSLFPMSVWEFAEPQHWFLGYTQDNEELVHPVDRRSNYYRSGWVGNDRVNSDWSSSQSILHTEDCSLFANHELRFKKEFRWFVPEMKEVQLIWRKFQWKCVYWKI